MGFPLLVRRYLYTESGPSSPCICIAGQRQTGNILWHHCSHIQTTSFLAFLALWCHESLTQQISYKMWRSVHVITVNFIAVLYAIWCHNELCYSHHESAGTKQPTVLPVRVRICPDARADDTIVWLSPEIIVMPWVCSQFKVSVAVASVKVQKLHQCKSDGTNLFHTTLELCCYCVNPSILYPNRTQIYFTCTFNKYNVIFNKHVTIG